MKFVEGKAHKDYVADVANWSAGAFERHTVQHEGGGVWRFFRPGQSFYAARVVFLPRTIIITGDFGHCIIVVSDTDSWLWARKHSAGSLDYFAGKVVALAEGKEAFYVQDATKYLFDEKQVHGDDAAEVIEALDAAPPGGPENSFSYEQWMEAWTEAGHYDPYRALHPSPGVMWMHFALLKFVALREAAGKTTNEPDASPGASVHARDQASDRPGGSGG